LERTRIAIESIAITSQNNTIRQPTLVSYQNNHSPCDDCFVLLPGPRDGGFLKN
jgi:hypothetical protein